MADKEFVREGDYPFMNMPSQQWMASEFYAKCKDLRDCMRRVYDFFIWYSQIKKNHCDELRAVIFLEGLLLQMLIRIKEIYLMRGERLYCQNVGMFKNVLSQVNCKMCIEIKYIQRSNGHLMEEQENGNLGIASMRRDIVEGFEELADWLRGETWNHLNRTKATKLVEDLNLVYEMDMFGCIGNSFEQHFNMVFNGFMLLASYPSEPDSQALYSMFRNTMDKLKEWEPWVDAFDAWKQKILDAYDTNNIEESSRKVEFLKTLWKKLDVREQNLLHKCGIVYSQTRSISGQTAMCQRIFKNINGNAVKGSVRMNEIELQQYLSYVIQKQYLDSEIDSLKPKPSSNYQNEPPNNAWRNRHLFKEKVDCMLLADCINEVYCRFYIDEENRETLQGKYQDLMAYLYIVCASEEYFENEEKNPFFYFCKKVCGFQTEVSDRTFRNRVDKLENLYRKACHGSSQKVDEKTQNDFHKVLRIFHGAKKYEYFRKALNG